MRLVLRRDRVRLPIWVVSIGGLLTVAAMSIREVYGAPEALATYAALVRGNAVMIIQSGPGHGLDAPTAGAVLVNETSMWVTIGVALMSTFLVARHTRAEEETGRAELVRAGPVGRQAPIMAALAVVVAANLVVGALVTAGAAATGNPGVGSIAFGAAAVGAGLVFTGIALLAAQVTTTARGVTAVGVGALAASCVLRAVGDVGDGTLSWLSPIGWAQAVRPFAGERWWVLALSSAVATVLVAGALRISARRDLGAGLVQQRPGPAHASRWSTRPLGLAFRLQCPSLVGWCLGMATLGLFYGAVGDEAEDVFADNPAMEDFLAQVSEASFTDAFFATSMMILAIIGSGFAVAAALRPRAEESAGRAESLLTTGANRWAWAGGQLAVASLGAVVVLASAGVGAGIGYAVAAGDRGGGASLLGAALVHAPAVLVLIGVAAALFGWAPRAANMAWAAFAAAALLTMLADLLRAPQWLRNVSPFEHAAALPAEAVSWVPLLALTAVAAGLTALGLAGFRRRDVG